MRTMPTFVIFLMISVGVPAMAEEYYKSVLYELQQLANRDDVLSPESEMVALLNNAVQISDVEFSMLISYIQGHQRQVIDTFGRTDRRDAIRLVIIDSIVYRSLSTPNRLKKLFTSLLHDPDRRHVAFHLYNTSPDLLMTKDLLEFHFSQYLWSSRSIVEKKKTYGDIGLDEVTMRNCLRLLSSIMKQEADWNQFLEDAAKLLSSKEHRWNAVTFAMSCGSRGAPVVIWYYKEYAWEPQDLVMINEWMAANIPMNVANSLKEVKKNLLSASLTTTGL